LYSQQDKVVAPHELASREAALQRGQLLNAPALRNHWVATMASQRSGRLGM